MYKPWTCRKCGAPMHGPNDHDTTAGCNVTWPSTITTGDTSGYVTSGPTIWGSEDALRLSRYNEAVNTISFLVAMFGEFDSDGNPNQATDGKDAAMRRAVNFLADEQKEEDANTNTYGYLRGFRP